MKSRDKKARHSIGINLSCDFSPALPLGEKVSKKVVWFCKGIPCHFL